MKQRQETKSLLALAMLLIFVLGSAWVSKIAGESPAGSKLSVGSEWSDLASSSAFLTEPVEVLSSDNNYFLKVNLRDSRVRFRVALANNDNGGLQSLAGIKSRFENQGYAQWALINGDLFSGNCSGNVNCAQGLTYIEGVHRPNATGYGNTWKVRGNLGLDESNDVEINVGDGQSKRYMTIGGGPRVLMGGGDPTCDGELITVDGDTKTLFRASGEQFDGDVRSWCNRTDEITMLAYSADGQYLYMGVSKGGKKVTQLAQWLKDRGAHEILRVDSGGSTGMYHNGTLVEASDGQSPDDNNRAIANAFALVVTYSAPPFAPSNVSASATGQTSVHLTWTDNSNNEDGFKIFRDGSQIATVGANTAAYDDNGLSCGMTYWYYVKAYNGAGDSDSSNADSATTDFCPPTPTPSPTPTPVPGTGVTLYEHANYAGVSEFFDSNDPDLSNNTIDEDTTSSIWIEGDYWAILFQDRSFEGGYEIFSDNDPDLSDNLDIGNDTTSSIMVGRGDPPADGVWLYRGPDYTETAERFDANDPDVSNNTIGEDTVTSIRIQGNYWAILFRDRSFEGDYEIFDKGDVSLHDNPGIGNDSTSSIMVGQGEPPANGVWLYRGPDYTETAERFDANDPDVSNNTIGEDTVTSIRIQGNYWAILFRDRSFEGGYEIFDKGDVSLHDNPGIGNDSTSSIMVGQGEPPANGVWLYRGPDYTETAERFDISDPDLSNNMVGEDTVTSIRIQGDYWAIVFRDRSFEGGYEIFDRGDVSLHDNPGIGNDSVSSIMVGQGEPPADGVWLYRGPGYTETAERFDSNDSDLSNNTVGEDMVTSIRIQGDYWSILFRDRNFAGNYEIFDRGDVSLHDNPSIGNDSASSIKVGQGEPPQWALFGDFNWDCVVNVADIMQVASRWRTSCENPDPDNNPNTLNYEACYDLDHDCDIDIVDIMLVAAHWGERCE